MIMSCTLSIVTFNRSVSVAFVKWLYTSRVCERLRATNLSQKYLLVSCQELVLPRKSAKPCFVMGEVATLVLKRSILLRKRMRAEFLNQCELAMDSQSMRASCIWFWMY